MTFVTAIDNSSEVIERNASKADASSLVRCRLPGKGVTPLRGFRLREPSGCK